MKTKVCPFLVMLLIVFGMTPPALSNDTGCKEHSRMFPNTTSLVTFSLSNHTVYRIGVKAGAAPENVSQELEKLAHGVYDARLNVSPNGAWYILESDRFNPQCVGWECLSLVTGDLSAGEVISTGGQLLRSDGFSAVDSSGRLVVYPTSGDGPHVQDLWAVTRSITNSAWSAPLLLTGASTYPYNNTPAISADAAGVPRVAFSCGNQPYTQNAICQVDVDGSDFRVLLTPADSPSGYPKTGDLRSPDYALDGSIVFEADWSGEQIWRLPAARTAPVLVGSDYGNDNSPCVLPDGQIVSLWLESPGSGGIHEIKVMSADGKDYYMLLTGTDVTDGGLGCGSALWRRVYLPLVEQHEP